MMRFLTRYRNVQSFIHTSSSSFRSFSTTTRTFSIPESVRSSISSGQMLSWKLNGVEISKFSKEWNVARYFSKEVGDREKLEDENEGGEDRDPSSSSSSSYSLPEDDEEASIALTDDEVQELTKGDEELIKKIKFIQMEHELGRQEGARVPRKIPMRRWIELIALPSRSGRRKFLEFLWRIEIKQKAEKRKKQEAKEQRLLDRGALGPRPSIEEDPYSMAYGLTRNAIFLRLYDTSINRFFHHRVISAMVLGQPLIIDCGYDEHMTPREAKNCAAQLEYLFNDNRQHADPMDVQLCNAHPESKLLKFLKHRIPTLYDAEYAVNITDKSYMELYPKRELVYLSPHARDELLEYSEDEVYIIGAMVDKTDPRPYSMAKAKKEGLRIKKLPLDRYVEFGGGSGKSLTINQMGNIMLEVRHSRDWNKALEFVPRRKLRREFEQEDGEMEYRRKERPSSVLQDYELMSQRKGFSSFSGDRMPSKHSRLRTIMSDN